MLFQMSPRMLEKAAAKTRWQAADPALFAAQGFTLEDAIELSEAINGRLLFPWDPDYPTARKGFNAGYEEFPRAIAYCADPGDVQTCLASARKLGLKVACRSGGHSYANYSVNNGLVVDVSEMNDISIDPVRKIAKVGAGTSFGKLLGWLQWHKLHVPSGAAPTVAIGGYMQGGGYGFTSREYGMNCDCVLEVTVMLADGTVVVANPLQNQELFFAIRGGTGNNFGVLLDVTYQLFDLSQVWGFRYEWSEDVAVDVLMTLQEKYTKTADVRLGYLGGLVQRSAASPPVALLMGTFHGTREEGLAVLQDLLAIGKPVTQVDRVGPYILMNALILTVPYGIPTEPTPMPGFSSISRVVTRPIDRPAWEAVLERFRKTPSFGNYLCIEPYGGAINARSPEYNAWSHRDGYMNVVSCAYWTTPTGDTDTLWLKEFMAPIDVFSDGASYQNYPSRFDVDFASRYWNERTLERLSVTRRECDPDELFLFQQTIPSPLATKQA